jgi:hypothetical protein
LDGRVFLDGMIRYDELRTWFWWRTWMWSIPCVILSVMVVFWRLGNQPLGFQIRFVDSASVGVGSVAFALIAARTSIGSPWMRFAWRTASVLNTLTCAASAAILAFIAGGTILAFAQNNPPDQFLAPKIYQTYLVHIDAILSCLRYGVILSALWGVIYGLWFALRRDRYFIEPN